MKILFEFSRSGIPEYLESYRTIKEAVIRHGHTLTNDFLTIAKRQPASLSEDIYSHITKSIAQADCVIIEGSIVSLSLGYVLTESLNRGKPVLFLSSGLKPQNRFAWSIKSKLLTNHSYSNLSELREGLATFFNTNEFVKTRFNLVLPNKIDGFVLKKSREKNTSKTEYILDLIKYQMRKEKS